MGGNSTSVSDGEVVVTAFVLSYKKKKRRGADDAEKFERILRKRTSELCMAVRASEKLAAADYEVRVY